MPTLKKDGYEWMKKVLQCPNCKSELKLIQGDPPLDYWAYECEACNECFTTTESDEFSLLERELKD